MRATRGHDSSGVCGNGWGGGSYFLFRGLFVFEKFRCHYLWREKRCPLADMRFLIGDAVERVPTGSAVRLGTRWPKVGFPSAALAGFGLLFILSAGRARVEPRNAPLLCIGVTNLVPLVTRAKKVGKDFSRTSHKRTQRAQKGWGLYPRMGAGRRGLLGTVAGTATQIARIETKFRKRMAKS